MSNIARTLGVKEFEMSEILAKVKKSRFAEKCRENKYPIVGGIAAGIIMLVIYAAFRMKPFGDITILRMDLYHQYGPLFAELYERIVNRMSLIYSWTSGLGSPFLGNYFNYLSSPIGGIIMLLFGHKNMPEAIAAMILVKCVLSAAFFTYYLKKSVGKESYVTSAFGVLYAFCSYFVAYYWNVMWLDAMALFPLVILGIERIINKGKPALFITSLAVIFLTNYYMAYMVCILSVLYFIYYYLSNYTLGKRFLYSGFTFAVSGVASALIMAFALVPVFFILKESSATSGTFPSEFKSYFKIFDFLANHLASVEPTIRSSGTDVLPNVYCGILTLILLPLYMLSKKISFREKVMSTVLLAVFYFSFNTNYLNYIWHGFHFPNDLPYRFSFAYSFILLLLAYKVFVRLYEFSMKAVALSGAALLAFIVIVQKLGSKNVDETSIWVSIALTVLFVIIIALVKNPKYNRAALCMLVLIAVSTDMVIGQGTNFSMSQAKEHYVSDYDQFKQLKADLDKYDKTPFYRMELTNLRTRMDNSWYFYNGVSVFSSMAKQDLAKMQKKLGMFGNNINSFTYNMQTPVYNAMMGLRYIVNNDDKIEMNPKLFERALVPSTQKFTAYKNFYDMPLAFGVSARVLDWSIENDDPFKVQADFFRLATGVSDVFEYLMPTISDSSNMRDIADSSLQSGSFSYGKINSNEDGSFTIEVQITKAQNVYVYFRCSGAEKYMISGSAFSKTRSFDREMIIDLGRHKAGDVINIEVPITKNSSGVANFYAVGLDLAKFREGYERLQKNGTLNLTEFKETYLAGDINLSSNMLVYTSIPYDKGWTVKVDGKALTEEEIYKVGGALLAFKLPAGAHRIEMSFSQQGLIAGTVISFFTILLIALFVFLIKKNRPKALQKLDSFYAEGAVKIEEFPDYSDEELMEYEREKEKAE